MKKLCLLLSFLFITSMLFSQVWIKNLPQNKSKQALTLFDYQKAFYDYWAPFNVENGFYVENGVKKKAQGWKQFKRWEYDMEHQVNPSTGKFPVKTGQQAYDEYLESHSIDNPANSANWTCLGTNSSTGGYAGIGRISCSAFHPSNTSIYWVGVAAGGLWATTNNGTTWTCVTDNNAVLAVSDIVIPTDYATSNTIYIATGDKDHWDNRSIGVLKSTNGGSTWNPTGISYTISSGNMVNRLLLDPNNNQVILAATSSGVYKTTNGGTTWNTLLTSSNFIDMEYKPGDFNTLYGCTTNGSIYVSSNGGTSWTQALTDGSAYRIELAVSANQPTWVYAIAANSASGLYKVYKSTNSGTSYSMVFAGTTLNTLGWNSDGGDSGGQGWYDLCLAVCPTNANIVLSGGVNTWRSTNGGTSWAIANHWWGDGVPAVHADKHSLSFRPNGDLFETNDGGIYISPDNGLSWNDKTNGIVNSQMYKLGVSATVSTETITGLQDNGTKLLSGGVWDDVKGGDGMECLIDYSDVNVQYGTYVNGQIDRTTNHWLSATNIQPSGAGSGAWVTPYIIDPVTPQTLYAGYADVWKTTNRGTSWTKISTMATANKIRSMAIAPSNNQYLYVADPSHIWKTINGGTSWSDITGSLPVGSGSLTYVTVKNDDPLTLWVTLSGYNATTVYQSVNAGSTWTNISAGLPSLPVYTIVQNKQSTSEVQLYVGTEVGVYFKKGTDNWIAFNTGLPNVKLGELEIYYATSPQSSILRAATFGRGLWETPVFYNCSPMPVPTITGPSAVCVGAPVTTYTTETGMTAYTWTVSSGGTITGGAGTHQITVSWTTTGAKSVSVNYTNSSGCSAQNPTTYNVSVNQSPFANYSFPANNCDGLLVQFTDISSPNGGSTLTGWNWNFGDPTSGTGNISTLENPSHLFTSSGTFTVQLIVGNNDGCSDTASYQVVIHSLPSATITPDGPTTFCQGDSVILTASSASSWLWSNGQTTQSIAVSVGGTFTVTVTDGFTCTATSAPTVVTILPLPGIPVTPSGPDSVDLHYIVSSDYTIAPAPNANSYAWALTPSTAGTLSGSATTATVTWSTYYLGSALIKVKSLNSCGESSWSAEKQTIVENTATGIVNLSKYSILIYPNPASSLLNIEFPEYSSAIPTSLDIYEIQGQWIKKVTITEKKTQLDISTLPDGIYMVRITLGNDSEMIKVVKTAN